MYSKILISGRLVEPADDKPRSGVTLTLSSVKNSSVVLKHATYRCVTGGNGEYSFNAAPGTYTVAVSVYGAEPERVGQIRVYSDSLPGNLNAFLMSPGEDDLTPEIIHLVDSMRISAAASASEAKKSEVQARSLASEVDSNAQAVQRNTDLVSQNTQTVNVKAQQVASNAQTVSSNTQSVIQMRDEVSTKTTLAQAAANTSTQNASLAAGHEASSAANARIAEDAAAAVQGVLIDGGECDLSSGAYPPPQTVAGKSYSTVWYVKTGGVVSGIAYDVGDVLRYTTAKGGYYFRVSAVGDSVAPLPDVWIPFNDSLRMFAGYGREVKVGDDVVARMVNFERSTTATYIDKSGVLRAAAINEPRFEKQGLLIEGQSTNLVVRSEGTTFQIANASFQTLTNNVSGVLPVVGQRILFAANNNETNAGLIQASMTLDGGSSYTYSLFIKVEDGDDSDLANCLGAYSTSSASITNRAVIQDFGNGVKRLSGNISVGGTGSQTVFIRVQRRGAWATTTWTAVVGGVQVESLPFASSYIPTNGTAVTRAADFPTLSRRGNDNYYAPITMVCEVDTSNAFVDDSANSRRGIFSGYPSVGAYEMLMFDPSSKKIAFAYGTASFAGGGKLPPAADGTTHIVGARFDGVSNSAFTDGIISAPSAGSPVFGNDNGESKNWLLIGYGAGSTTTRHVFGHIRNFRIWHCALSDAQIRGLK